MTSINHHIFVADIGGTNLRVAIIAQSGRDRYNMVCDHTFRTAKIRNIPAFLGNYLKREGRRLIPRVESGCIDFAGPIDSRRKIVSLTNLDLRFTARETIEATGLERLTLLNDFEAVGYGLEVLIENRPDAFVRLSRRGRLPHRSEPRSTAVVLGAGTGLGTTILMPDPVTRRFRPLPGEGGHVDYGPVEEEEFQIAQWIRRHKNDSPRNPLNRERVVSGRGLAFVYEALAELRPDLGRPSVRKAILRTAASHRPAVVAQNASRDSLCRKTLDVWLRSYARAAKNSAILPLAPGGVFLAGGIAGKILPEMRSGTFMREFLRCDIPSIRAILKQIAVFVITDSSIGLYGCANVAVNGLA
jgi:glucokinase